MSVYVRAPPDSDTNQRHSQILHKEVYRCSITD